MSLVENERTKLTANWFNTIAAASITTGFIAPIVAFSLGVYIQVSAWSVVGLSAFWLVLGSAVHWFARRLLRRLERERP